MKFARLYELLRRFEGLRLKPYICPAGVPTIGYGHTGPDVTMSSPPITVEQAEAFLVQDAEVYIRAVANLSPVLLSDVNKHSAIASFAFNLGTTRYKASTLKRRVDAQDWEGAVDELGKWVWGGGKRLPGLVARRAAEAQLLR